MNLFKFLRKRKRIRHGWNVPKELDIFAKDIYLEGLLDVMKENDPQHMFDIVGEPMIPKKIPLFRRIMNLLKKKDLFDE